MSVIAKKIETKWKDHDFCAEILDDAYDGVGERLAEYLTKEELEEIGDDDEKMAEALQALNRCFIRWLYKTHVEDPRA